MHNDARRRFVDLIRRERRSFGGAVARFGLRLAAIPYGVAVGLRNAAFDYGWLRSARARVPVVSVGNLTVGGTGKTPCVEYIASYYRDRDVRAAILSRGYGAAAGPNDEALLLEENLPDVPHLQGADRVALAHTAVEELDSEVLILDDGFQHRRLQRNLDLVLIDATCPWGLGHLLPRGLLREPIAGLRRAQGVLLTRCDQVSASSRAELIESIAKIAPAAAVIATSHEAVTCRNADGDTASLHVLEGAPVAAFCGVGNPEAFRQTLADLGANLQAFRVFPDHHAYSRTDVDGLETWARSLDPASLLVTTQKDLVKIPLTHLGDRPLWCVRVQLRIESGRNELHRLLDSALTRGRSQWPREEGEPK